MWLFYLKTRSFSQKAQLQLNIIIPIIVQVAFQITAPSAGWQGHVKFSFVMFYFFLFWSCLL